MTTLAKRKVCRYCRRMFYALPGDVACSECAPTLLDALVEVEVELSEKGTGN